MSRTLLVIALLFAPSCKKKPTDEAVTSGSGSSVGSAPQPVVSPADAAAMTTPNPVGGPSLPSDARAISEREKKADLSSLGTDLSIQLIEQINADAGDPERKLDLKLVVTGTGSAVVDLGYELDPVSKEDAAKSLRAVAPLSPERPFDKADAPKLLPFKGPLLYLQGWKSGNVAVGKDGDAIVVWRMDITTDEDEYISDWYEQTRLAVASGAKLAAK
jgi:hypothetical protein